jgi:hypothetical protein
MSVGRHIKVILFKPHTGWLPSAIAIPAPATPTVALAAAAAMMRLADLPSVDLAIWSSISTSKLLPYKVTKITLQHKYYYTNHNF